MSVEPNGISGLVELGPKIEGLRGQRRKLAALLPDGATLREAFSRSVSGVWVGSAIVNREPAPSASTFPGEVFICRLADGGERPVLCKYGVSSCHDTEGHGGGPAYEALVYREILSRSELRRPEFLGCYEHPVSGETWLFLEYLADAVRLDESSEPWESVARATQWAARFHEEQAKRLDNPTPELRVYDEAYYLRWPRRVAGFASGDDLAWLRRVCEIFEGHVEAMTRSAQTVIHGEFTVHNVLCTDSSICPVDWESAAIAPGVIDLASMTEGWPAELAERCVSEYKSTLSPNETPSEFASLLDVARVYWSLRWLGHKSDVIPSEKGQRRLQRLHEMVARLRWT